MKIDENSRRSSNVVEDGFWNQLSTRWEMLKNLLNQPAWNNEEDDPIYDRNTWQSQMYEKSLLDKVSANIGNAQQSSMMGGGELAPMDPYERGTGSIIPAMAPADMRYRMKEQEFRNIYNQWRRKADEITKRKALEKAKKAGLLP